MYTRIGWERDKEKRKKKREEKHMGISWISIQTLDFHCFWSFHFPRLNRDFLPFSLSFCLRRSCFSRSPNYFFFLRNMNNVRYCCRFQLDIRKSTIIFFFLLLLLFDSSRLRFLFNFFFYSFSNNFCLLDEARNQFCAQKFYFYFVC